MRYPQRSTGLYSALLLVICGTAAGYLQAVQPMVTVTVSFTIFMHYLRTFRLCCYTALDFKSPTCMAGARGCEYRTDC